MSGQRGRKAGAGQTRTIAMLWPVMVCWWLLSPLDAFAGLDRSMLQDPDKIGQLLAEEQIQFEEIPATHWQPDSCPACHVGEAAGPGEMAPLRKENINELCDNCHNAAVVAEYIHAVGMEPPEDFLERMPEDFLNAVERGGGVVSCITCHDMPLQCKQELFPQREINPLFFRGGPYAERTNLCFQCHDPKDYERYNPHDQITDEGELDTEQCFFCHNVTPNRAQAKSIDDVTFNVAEDLKMLCTGCHPYKPHPGGVWYQPRGNLAGGGPNHLREPPPEIAERMQRMQAKEGTIMPLDKSTGRIFCATCHNPHERGVQYLRKADVGADGYKRLRRGKYEICMTCHDM